MNPTVVFNELWLLSERDASARHLKFHPHSNLLAGSNGTGKSRVLKHLVWALGCEPARRAAGEFDSNIVAALELSVGSSKTFTFLRQGRKRAAFDELGLLRFATESSTKWNEFFSETFGFRLMLQRKEEGEFGLAGPDYAMLPFYIDQDSGWGPKWTTFPYLGQFVKWQTPVFSSFTGLKTASYLKTQVHRDRSAVQLKNAKVHLKLQETSYKRVLEMLPAESTTLDEAQFAQELREVSDLTKALREEQDEVRAHLFKLAQRRQQLTAELNMALASERELIEDQAFLADYSDDAPLVCPTCSHVHTATFHARQMLATDAHDIHEVVIRLQTVRNKLQADEAALQLKLNAVVQRLRALSESLTVQREGRPVADVVVAKSLSVLKDAYDITRRDLAAELDSAVEDVQEYDLKLQELTDKEREKRIRASFKEDLITFAGILDIAKAEIASKVTIGTRSPNASGSYAPRAVLANHLALLSTHMKYGDGPKFPFIVDTPQQSGQDPVSLGRMLDIILKRVHLGQTMVATESIPDNWVPPGDCNVLEFGNKRHLLQEDAFRQGVFALGDMVKAMHEELLKQVPVADESAQDGDIPASDAFDDEGEDD
jgi:hypothetical protein